MKPIPECVPDALRMILAAAKAVSDEDFIHRKVLLKVMGEVAEEGDLGSNPADFHLRCWEIACRSLGVKDPYDNAKARGDKIALGILKYLAENYPPTPGEELHAAIRTSLIGSMLEFTGLGRQEMEEKIAAQIAAVPARDDSDALMAAIHKADSLLLVANRAGEIALDKPLAEVALQMGKRVYLAVAATPVYFMATAKDAATAGFPKEVEVVNPGTAMYGLMQERASTEFQDLFEKAGVVVVKGCTHLTTMTLQRDVFFILKAVEEEAAERIGIPFGSGAVAKLDAVG